METSEKGASKGFLADLYDFFCSIKLSIVVLIALALTSIFGTVIEQGKEPATYAQAYGTAVAQIIQILNLGDMYHSWWFLLLLILLLVNITCCSLRRLPHAVRLMKDRDPVFDGRPVAIHERWEQTVKGHSVERAAAAAEAVLTEKLGKPVRQEKDGKVYLFSTKGGWSRMGVYMTHSSLFLFAVGAQIGVWAGLKGYVEIPEGQSVREVAVRGGGSHDLGFEIRCDKFDVTFYNDPVTGQPTGRPKDYVSRLSIVDNGRVVAQKTIEVNDPLIYPPSLFSMRSFYFYQSSYGQKGGKAAQVTVYGERRNLLASRARLEKGGAVDLEGGGKLRLLDLTADFRGTGPAILVAVEHPGRDSDAPVVVQPSERGPVAVGPLLVTLDSMETAMYTGLQVALDPGVPVIWAGCILITIGLLVAFFLSHRRVWVRVSAAPGGAQVLFAGNASRNRIAFEKWFGELAQRAKESFEK